MAPDYFSPPLCAPFSDLACNNEQPIGLFGFISNFARGQSVAYITFGQTFVTRTFVAALTFGAIRFAMGRSLCKYS